MNIDPNLMHSAADQASDLLKSLANSHRLMILCQLLEGERSVGELAAFLDLRSSTVSQHLALLRREGLVVARREAQTIYYDIASQPARRILETLFELFCAPEAARLCGAEPDTAGKH
ncbi:helix-turn-helix transcriptional regulator [Acidocella sp. KAb 2-4]|uniref:ArsR/SmtB family transcription factor n=1 Tax=Acidocella sp. KAb 2-4 TaxID=2885158 RepID=UPI001D085017|nr:metalloregulator ArsR/SmtB family transcription factor [Acidocella sp. KAb 2-4]MCB5944034.1 metalloregulator ArsR/SmtB family transcription factor [Acidocella sp. KAb 2-4]